MRSAAAAGRNPAPARRRAGRGTMLLAIGSLFSNGRIPFYAWHHKASPGLIGKNSRSSSALGSMLMGRGETPCVKSGTPRVGRRLHAAEAAQPEPVASVERHRKQIRRPVVDQLRPIALAQMRRRAAARPQSRHIAAGGMGTGLDRRGCMLIRDRRHAQDESHCVRNQIPVKWILDSIAKLRTSHSGSLVTKTSRRAS